MVKPCSDCIGRAKDIRRLREERLRRRRDVAISRHCSARNRGCHGPPSWALRNDPGNACCRCEWMGKCARKGEGFGSKGRRFFFGRAAVCVMRGEFQSQPATRYSPRPDTIPPQRRKGREATVPPFFRSPTVHRPPSNKVPLQRTQRTLATRRPLLATVSTTHRTASLPRFRRCRPHPPRRRDGAA